MYLVVNSRHGFAENAGRVMYLVVNSRHGFEDSAGRVTHEYLPADMSLRRVRAVSHMSTYQQA